MEAFDNTEGLAHHIREYVEIRIQEVKLDVADKSSAFMADMISRTLLFVIILLVILFASMAGAYVLGEMWDRMWLGFVVVSGFYVVLALIAWAIKERMIRIPIFISILKHLTRKDDDD